MVLFGISGACASSNSDLIVMTVTGYYIFHGSNAINHRPTTCEGVNSLCCCKHNYTFSTEETFLHVFSRKSEAGRTLELQIMFGVYYLVYYN